MMKLILLVVGLAVGFGGGLYFSSHHPSEAAALEAAQERKLIEMQIKTSEAVKKKLDAMSAKQQSQAAATPDNAGPVSDGATNAAPDPQINTLRDQQNQLLQQLHQRLNKLSQ
jgi:hypothetical protein